MHGLIAKRTGYPDGKKFDWRIEIPANTTATVYVPATNLEAVKAQDAKASRFENGRAVFELGSGKCIILSVNETDSQSRNFDGLPRSLQRGAMAENQSAIVKSEFIFETAPFPSCHASTIAETKAGLAAAWFGGTAERNPDVGIYRRAQRKWADGLESTESCVTASGSPPEPLACTWNPGFVPAKERAGIVAVLWCGSGSGGVVGHDDGLEGRRQNVVEAAAFAGRNSWAHQK